ncbi:MAG: NAD(P)-dependent oxidoreductase [Syntrophaceae bacterium]
MIAVTGAGSFIGNHLLRSLLVSRDVHLRLLVHKNKNLCLPAGTNASIIQGDLLQPETLKEFTEEGCTVVNLAYISGATEKENIAAAKHLIDACKKSGVRRLIHCSTAVVSGRVNVDSVTEDTPLNPFSQYEVAKANIEKIIIEKTASNFDVVILRPTAVFGSGGQNLMKMANNLCKGNQMLNYIKSCLFQRRRMNLVPVDTVVAAIIFLINAPRKSINQEVFIISDDDDPANNFRDIEKYLMKQLGFKDYPLPVVPIPFIILKMLLTMMHKSSTNPRRVYECKKIAAAGFKKPLTFQEGLSRFTDWYKHSCM